MKICFSLSNKFFFPLINEFKKNKYKIIIIPAVSNKTILSDFKKLKKNYNFGPFDKHGFWQIEKNEKYQEKLKNYLKKEKPDLIISDSVFPSGYSALIVKSLKIPFLSYCSGDDIEYLPEIGYGFKGDKRKLKLIKILIKYIDGFLGSPFALKQLKKNWGVNQKKFLPIVVPIANCKKIKNKIYLKKKWGFKKDDFIILSLSRIHPVKGLEYLIKAIPLVLKKKKIHLIIAGSADKIYYKNKLDLIIKKLNINDYIDFKGHILSKKKDELFSLSDAFVIASLLETGPRTALETINYQLPLITTKVGYAGSLLKNRKNCLFIKQKNPQDIAKKLMLLFADQKLREKIIFEEKKLAEQLTCKKQINNWINIFEKATS